jgi:hypothetical protein
VQAAEVEVPAVSEEDETHAAEEAQAVADETQLQAEERAAEEAQAVADETQLQAAERAAEEVQAADVEAHGQAEEDMSRAAEEAQASEAETQRLAEEDEARAGEELQAAEVEVKPVAFEASLADTNIESAFLDQGAPTGNAFAASSPEGGVSAESMSCSLESCTSDESPPNDPENDLDKEQREAKQASQKQPTSSDSTPILALPRDDTVLVTLRRLHGSMEMVMGSLLLTPCSTFAAALLLASSVACVLPLSMSHGQTTAVAFFAFLNKPELGDPVKAWDALASLFAAVQVVPGVDSRQIDTSASLNDGTACWLLCIYLSMVIVLACATVSSRCCFCRSQSKLRSN